MPYLDQDWMIGDKWLSAGTWVPERNWERWQEQEKELDAAQQGLLTWRRQRDITSFPTEADRLPAECLRVLASDMASAQRDGFIYANFIERLKNAPSDATTDEIVDDMRTLGFASADWPAAVGGPPPHKSSRPFGKVLDWLFRNAAKVGKFVLNCVNFVLLALPAGGISAVAVGIGLPVQVSVEFSPELLTNPEGWQKLRDFVDKWWAEFGKPEFSS
jgi:hypothetical protein